MLKLALIGQNVLDSFSPEIHHFILGCMGENCTFEKVSVRPEEFGAKIEGIFERFDGFNITIPFKREILPYLKELSGDAKLFGSVNTVVSETRNGYNTDGFGFLLMLQNEGVELKSKKVLVLGTGGAGRSCMKELIDAGAQVYAYNRTADRLKQVYAAFQGFTPLFEIPREKFDIIINCTGVGMHETEGQTPEVCFEGGRIAPVDELLASCETAVDLIYRPEKSEFLQVAERCGKKVINGFAMLFYQAYMADCIFLRKEPIAEEARRLFKKYGGTL